MCVCASIRPGSPVYFERSIVSAPAGIAEVSVVTVRILPLSTMTIAFVQTLPFPSHSFPKRMALMFLSPDFSWAKTRVDTSVSNTVIAIRNRRMRTVPRAHNTRALVQRSNSVFNGMQTRFADQGFSGVKSLGVQMIGDRVKSLLATLGGLSGPGSYRG